MIEAQGPISVAQYMTLALHDPDRGVYASRDPIGRTGDFVTAPEISQMFGELLGLWVLEDWLEQGRPERLQLTELGPGRGTLMKDACALPNSVRISRALDVVLIEASPTLQIAQAKNVQRFRRKIRGPPGSMTYRATRHLSLANEFFDALPVRQYRENRTGLARAYGNG